MIKVCYLFTLIIEQFISYLYFKNNFNRKRQIYVIIVSYIISFLFQYTVSLFSMPYFNLVSFCIANLIVVLICFEAKLKKLLFNMLLLATILLSSTFFNIELFGFKNNEIVLFLETAVFKTLYFLIAFIISKLSKKEKSDSHNKNDYSLLLFILLVSSIITIVSFSLLSYLHIYQNINILFSITTLLILFSNIIVFLIHEKIIVTLTKSTKLQLEKQKASINEEYYSELKKQYETSNILIHDIKKCLLNIKELSARQENKEIIEYINSIYDGYEIKSIQQFSKNKLVNVIVSRYAQLCITSQIDLIVDIRDIDFSFITDSHLTAILDNLLENAYEAAEQSLDKEINLLIECRNENYILIEINNSSDIEPKFNEDAMITTKSDKMIHGIGSKSISRIVKQYSGNLNYQYDKNAHIFKASIILKKQPAETLY